ncbi:MAG TPA: ABC transporter ATP-binding protein [Ilumatobacteraceae bacterium]|nr:ABC transporter ATP-binding protein [Ilumatobacteraceae bacterium]
MLAVLQVITKLAEPWPLGWLVDNALTGPPQGSDSIHRELVIAVGSLAFIVAIGAFFDYWSTRLLSSAGLHVANDMRGRAFTHLHRMSLGYHKRHQVGDLTARVTADVDYTQDMLVQVLANLFPNLLLVIGMFVVMLTVDPFLTLLSLMTTPLLALSIHRSRRNLRQASRRVRKADGAVASLATESLGAIGLVQAFTLERYQSGHFEELTGDSLTAGVEAVRLQARFAPMVDAAGLLSTLIVLWVGATKVANGEMKLGVLLIFLTYVGSLYKPVKALSKLTMIFTKGMAAAERIEEVLSAEPDIKDRRDAIVAPTFRGHVRFEEVTFSYGREPVLWAVSFDIHAGQTVALVGPTGAGKSTLAALIPRLIDPISGHVRIDERDIRDYTVASVRSQISMVLQDTVLLRGTIRDNIACGRPGASWSAVERAAKLALVDEFSDRLPDGLDTRVAERGVDLSGGQRQRIAIARAILRDAPILILDEPTSALDTESEELIVTALDNLPRSRTMLIIAHRLSTVRRADRIVVLDGGAVVEEGVHDDLISRGGLYSRLQKQSRSTPDGYMVHTKRPVPPPPPVAERLASPFPAPSNDLTSAQR